MCPNNWDNFFALIILNVFKENAYFHISSNIIPTQREWIIQLSKGHILES